MLAQNQFVLTSAEFIWKLAGKNKKLNVSQISTNVKKIAIMFMEDKKNFDLFYYLREIFFKTINFSFSEVKNRVILF